MIGLDVLSPGKLALLTGSSHLHLLVSDSGTPDPGIWGPYSGVPLPGLCFAEGGQSSTGALLRWAKECLCGGQLSYAQLDEEASKIPIGSGGVMVLETFQGSRTPATDPHAKGAVVGLTLAHTRAHIWRACLEAACMGTACCIEALVSAGHEVSPQLSYTALLSQSLNHSRLLWFVAMQVKEITLAGGVTRSKFWLVGYLACDGISISKNCVF